MIARIASLTAFTLLWVVEIEPVHYAPFGGMKRDWERTRGKTAVASSRKLNIANQLRRLVR